MTERFSPTRVALSLISAYQGLRAGHPSPCRFYPSCSVYASQAIETYGVLHGGWLALRRLLRCQPLGPKGVDLVPIHVEERRSR